MKRALIVNTSVIAVCALGAWLALRPHAAAVTTAPGTDSAEVVSTVHTVRPVKATLPLIVSAYGEVAPGQTMSISVPRAGQLVVMALLPGQRVAKGGLLMRLTNDPVADTADAQARSALTLADAELQRTQALFALQLATASQVDTARRLVDDARGNVSAQQRLGGASRTQEVVAPFDGVVLSLSAAQGDRVSAGAPLLQFGRIDKLRVLLGIEPAERQRVQIGDVVALTAQLSHGPGEGVSSATLQVDGHLTGLQNLVDPKTQLVNAVVALPDSASSTWVPGMRVEARIVTGTRAGWLVPRLSVLTDDQGAYLFQIRDAVARRVAVTRATEQADQLGINGDLSENLPIVSLGNYELVDGMKVKEIVDVKKVTTGATPGRAKDSAPRSAS